MSINDSDSKERKTKFAKMVKDAGFTSIGAFAKEAEIPLPNIYSNLDGTFNMSIKRMFKVANMLGVPILQVIEIFYPNELEENQRAL